MSNNKEFLGLTQNDCFIQGKVIGEPVVQGENYAFMNIRTSISEINNNGQWTDVVIDIPVITTDAKKVTTIAQYVHDGRELLINAYYKSWIVDNTPTHAFFIKKMNLGRKKWVPKEDKTPALQ